MAWQAMSGLRGYRPWRHELRFAWSETGTELLICPRRPRGTAQDVEAAYQAMLDLERATERDNDRLELQADQLGLTGRSRQRFYGNSSESDEWIAVNDAAGEALDRISYWQERRVRARL